MGERYRWTLHKCCSIVGDHITLLLGGVIGQAEDGFHPLHSCNHCDSNTSIATRSFDQGTAFLEQAPSFSILHDPKSRSIFDRPTWIKMLTLGHDLASSGSGQGFYFNHWGISDCLEHTWSFDFHIFHIFSEIWWRLRNLSQLLLNAHGGRQSLTERFLAAKLRSFTSKSTEKFSWIL